MCSLAVTQKLRIALLALVAFLEIQIKTVRIKGYIYPRLSLTGPVALQSQDQHQKTRTWYKCEAITFLRENIHVVT